VPYRKAKSQKQKAKKAKRFKTQILFSFFHKSKRKIRNQKNRNPTKPECHRVVDLEETAFRRAWTITPAVETRRGAARVRPITRN
jgi:hypothetical protein